MPVFGVNVAIFQRDRLLLTQREDFEIWCLPGGSVEPGESIAQAAVRESQEETGLDVRLTRLVGVYSRPGIGSFVGHIFLFAAEPVAGKLRPQPGETIDLCYFAQGESPSALLHGQQRRIADAWSGVGGSAAWYQDQVWPFPSGQTYEDLFELRDRSGLQRNEFYRRFLGQTGPRGDFRELPPDKGPLPEPTSQEYSDFTGHPDLAANVAVIQEKKILLARREDFNVWCIPGGMVDPGESLADAARRELREETGLDVSLDRLIGVYSEPQRFRRGLHVVLFAGHATGGKLRLQPEEILQADYFGRDELPDDFLYGHYQRIMDTFNGVGGGVVWTQAVPWPFDPALTRTDIYNLRDRSGLSRSAYYQSIFDSLISGEEVAELSV